MNGDRPAAREGCSPWHLSTSPDHPVRAVCDKFAHAVRTAKFVARKQWVITGADDMFVRVYNHNTMEKIKSFEAHTDYIRCAAVRCRRRRRLFCCGPACMTRFGMRCRVVRLARALLLSITGKRGIAASTTADAVRCQSLKRESRRLSSCILPASIAVQTLRRSEQGTHRCAGVWRCTRRSHSSCPAQTTC
jgi:hypothetical protein